MLTVSADVAWSALPGKLTRYVPATSAGAVWVKAPAVTVVIRV